MLFLSTLLAITFPVLALSYSPQAIADEITSLPGAESLDVKFRQFSGYLDIPGSDGTKSKHMHYWFVESENNPSTDPIAFWTNGGPGCSGLLGFMTEHGPFQPNADNTLRKNDYSWNKIANMVYIESPVGVGFSYSDNKDDLQASDASTALDNYNLIQAFLDRFPEYRQNALYISSESYGGHYIPTLARKIVDMNQAGNGTRLNFKGFAVGNPYTDPYSGTPSSIDTYFGHQLISQPLYEEYVQKCGKDGSKVTLQCELAMAKAMNSIGNINPYALSYPVCVSAQALWQMNHQLALSGLSPKKLGLKSPPEYEPCVSNYNIAYLNQPAVKAAIHVKNDIKWAECSYSVRYDTTDRSKTSTASIYNYLIDNKFGLDILVFSGDDDAVCSTLGTQAWIWKLGYEVATNWQVNMLNGQTVGFLSQWKDTKLGFLTVHGAGHEVPTYKPEVALDMWKRYLAGEFTNK